MATGLVRPASPSQASGHGTDGALPAHLAAAFEQWRLAGLRVRLCAHPDEPRLVARYLAAGDELRVLGLPAWEIALESAWLLVAVAGDRALPMHWRCLCLDHVHRPLAVIERHTIDDQRRRLQQALRWELARLDLAPTDE